MPVTDEGDFHATANKKKAQVLEVCEDIRSHAEAVAHSLLSTFPLDHLSNRLQMLDFAGNAMLELTDEGPNGSLPKCLRTYWEIANPWQESAHSSLLPALQWHLEAFGVAPEDFLHSARAKVCGVAAAAWARLLKYSFPPWSLVCAHMKPEQEMQSWERFLAMPPCCLDSWWGEPLQSMMKKMLAAFTLQQLVECFRPAYVKLARRLLRATNMSLEGELSEIGKCVPSYDGRAPTAERLLYTAHLQAVYNRMEHFVTSPISHRVCLLLLHILH